MTSTLIFILLVLILNSALTTWADVLNLKHLSLPLPEEFKAGAQGEWDEAKYQASLNYQREGVIFELIRSNVHLMATLGFILLGGFRWVDEIARGFGWSSIPTGLLFLGILGVLKFFLQFPFSIYDTFVLEEKYGFNRTTWGLFLLDLIKGAILMGILGGLVFSGILYFFESLGEHAWFYCWLSVTGFQLLLTYLAPVWIMPLFNRFEPLPEGELKQAIEGYARSRNFQLSGIYRMDSSKRSTKSNAFFTGFGRFRRLVLFDTLIENHTVLELLAVIAHEVGHFERKHILKSMVLSILTSLLVFFLLGLLMNREELFLAFQMTSVSVYASLVFAGFIYAPLLRIVSIVSQVLSRKYEFEADQFAVETSFQPEALVSALKKLSRDNLSHLTPHPLKVFLDYSHPPVLARIEAIRAHGRRMSAFKGSPFTQAPGSSR
ncbi:MAG: M48 family metallopeptidase [Bdellovibrionia bacterium]